MGKFIPTVALDFDGVIHSYSSGWQGASNIPDPPVPGIKEAINELRQRGYQIMVFSSRATTYPGYNAIREWMTRNHIHFDNITSEKPPCLVTVDDRAICFDGNASTLVDKVVTFKPWYQQG